MNRRARLVILKEDISGYTPTGDVITLLKGTVVSLKNFTSIALSGGVVIWYNPDERRRLFEPLDPEEVIY